jgi:hypothetical protein
MMQLPAISKDELLDAIRAGVRDAVWEMITNATSAPCEDFFDTVKSGIETGVSNAMPFQTEILNAIEAGVKGRRA